MLISLSMLALCFVMNSYLGLSFCEPAKTEQSSFS